MDFFAWLSLCVFPGRLPRICFCLRQYCNCVDPSCDHIYLYSYIQELWRASEILGPTQRVNWQQSSQETSCALGAKVDQDSTNCIGLLSELLSPVVRADLRDQPVRHVQLCRNPLHAWRALRSDTDQQHHQPVRVRLPATELSKRVQITSQVPGAWQQMQQIDINFPSTLASWEQHECRARGGRGTQQGLVPGFKRNKVHTLHYTTRVIQSTVHKTRRVILYTTRTVGTKLCTRFRLSCTAEQNLYTVYSTQNKKGYTLHYTHCWDWAVYKVSSELYSGTKFIYSLLYTKQEGLYSTLHALLALSCVQGFVWAVQRNKIYIQSTLHKTRRVILYTTRTVGTELCTRFRLSCTAEQNLYTVYSTQNKKGYTLHYTHCLDWAVYKVSSELYSGTKFIYSLLYTKQEGLYSTLHNTFWMSCLTQGIYSIVQNKVLFELFNTTRFVLYTTLHYTAEFRLNCTTQQSLYPTLRNKDRLSCATWNRFGLYYAKQVKKVQTELYSTTKFRFRTLDTTRLRLSCTTKTLYSITQSGLGNVQSN